MEKVFLTADGKKQLEERLHFLKVQGREENAEKIRVARDFGDLSENAEYDIAMAEQAKVEAEILEIEAKLANVEVIIEDKKRDAITIGNTIEMIDVANQEKFVYQIVGTHEADPSKGRISNESPVGKALIGKRKGDIVPIMVTDPNTNIRNKWELKVVKFS